MLSNEVATTLPVDPREVDRRTALLMPSADLAKTLRPQMWEQRPCVAERLRRVAQSRHQVMARDLVSPQRPQQTGRLRRGKGQQVQLPGLARRFQDVALA